MREQLTQFGDQPVRWLEADGADAPTLYVHGVPNAADMWRPFLERGGGIAVDLLGFGRSGKVADGDYTISGYTDFLERFLDHLELDRVRLVMHDWGAVGLAFAQRAPARVERLVAIDVVPFLPGYQWHRLARLWRRRGVGELVMGAMNPFGARRLTGLPKEQIREIFETFDQGTQRAILQLYRSSDPDRLAQAGLDLGLVDAPALVLWGDDDPYLPPRFADALAEALPNGTVEHVPGAGHWPWLDRPELVDRVVRWIASD